MLYKPTMSSFLGSAAFSLIPAATAGTVTFFMWEKASALLLAAGVLMGILSLILLLQDVMVHLRRLHVDELSVSVVGPLLRERIKWTEVAGAVLKERKNAMTRTDHLLIIRSAPKLLSFNTSTLSQNDEENLLAFVRSKVPVVVEGDKPAL